ncbi:hypothetical protein [Streptomyces sp. TRM75563]|uniref:hypothetical protein n=1 Tax=Streptomyces sp. TRM75563 TaxID=2817418 RepID=UPI001F625BC0|nr:hypothetical protein [Streptomyces sp. TRM75563]MCI4040526.1 hypothetical protein [Streptomyces sp. TRM75563]
MRLDALRRAVTGSPLREGPFDLDAVTRYVLGLGEREAVTRVQRGELFRVALDENVEGARGLAGLAAFRLVLDGVSSVARTLPRTGGSRGRNWTGGRVRELDTSQAVGVAQQPYGVPPLGEADPAPYVVLAAEGGHDHVVVLDGDGTPHRVTTEVFAELLALGPLLDGMWFASHYRKLGDKPISHESDEHLARKERVAKDSEDHGFPRLHRGLALSTRTGSGSLSVDG